MKKKILLTSILSVVMCLSLIVGATLALFGSESKKNIAVTSGKVEVEANIAGITTYSKGVATAGLEGGENGVFENGGTAEVVGDTIDIEGMSPGDKVVAEIQINNTSNIEYVQRFGMKGEGDSALLKQMLVGVSKADTDANYTYYNSFVSAWSNENAATQTRYISIELPEYVGSSAQGKDCEYTLSVEAVQGNADVSGDAAEESHVYLVEDQQSLTETLKTMGNGETVVLWGGEEKWTTADISFEDEKSITVCGYNVGTLTINAPLGSIEYYIAHTGSIERAVVAGESLHIYGEVGELTLNSGRTVVESGASVDAVDVVPTESEAKVEIRQNAEVQSVTSRPAQDATAIIVIDKDTVLPVLVAEGEGETKLDSSGTVEDTQGGGTLIEGAVSFESFVAKLAEGGNISLAADIGVYADPSLSDEEVLVPLLTIDRDTTLDLNGYKIYVEYDAEGSYIYTPAILSIDGANVVIEGNGTIDAEAGDNNSYGISLVNGASLTVNDGTYYGAMTAIQVSSGELTVNGGFFDLAETCKAAVPEYAKYVINCIDSSFKNGTAKIFVKGGTFVNFDPSDNPEGAGTTYLADGYEAIPSPAGDETHYTVQPLWDGTAVDTSWYNEEDAQFTLNTAMQLAGLASLVNGGNDFAGKTVTLGADINLNNQEWTPIGNGGTVGSGTYADKFAGTFDGSGYTISGLAYSGDDYAANILIRLAYGLFGVVTGTVQNFTLANVSIEATDCECLGAVAGVLAEGGTIYGVTVESGKIAGGDGVGGIVGRMVIEGTIENCTNKADIDSSDGKAGGIVAAAYYTRQDKFMNIIGCSNSGAIVSAGGYVGGIVGMNCGNVTDCTNTGTVTASGTSVGGIVGEQQNYGIVSGNINKADITNNFNDFGTGGIVGWVRYSGSDSDYQMKAMVEVTGNRNSGSVTGGTSSGGIVGHIYNNCLVSGNINTATEISSDNFAAGIVGSLQYSSASDFMGQCDLRVIENVSTTPAESIDGACVDQFAYNNDSSNEHGFIVAYNFTSESELEETVIIHVADVASFNAALASINEGSVIILDGDIDFASAGYDDANPFVVDAEGITIDLCGRTIYTRNVAFIISGANVTIQNGNIARPEGALYSYGIKVNGQNATIKNIKIDSGINVSGYDGDAVKAGVSANIIGCTITLDCEWAYYAVCAQGESSAILDDVTINRTNAGKANNYFWVEKEFTDDLGYVGNSYIGYYDNVVMKSTCGTTLYNMGGLAPESLYKS